MENKYYLFEKKPNGFLDFSLFSESLEGIISKLDSIYHSLEDSFEPISDFDNKKMYILSKSKFFLNFDYNKAKRNFDYINPHLKEKYNIKQKPGYYYSLYAGYSKMPKGKRKEVFNRYLGIPFTAENSSIDEFFITSENYKIIEDNLRNRIVLKNNSNQAFEDLLEQGISLTSNKYLVNKDFTYF